MIAPVPKSVVPLKLPATKTAPPGSSATAAARCSYGAVKIRFQTKALLASNRMTKGVDLLRLHRRAVEGGRAHEASRESEADVRDDGERQLLAVGVGDGGAPHGIAGGFVELRDKDILRS